MKVHTIPKEKSIFFRHFLLLNTQLWILVGNLLSHFLIHLHINLCEWLHLKDSRMLIIRKNGTSKMGCIHQESHQSQHGLKNSLKITLKKAYQKIWTSKIFEILQYDFRPCLYVSSQNEWGSAFIFCHFSCGFLNKHLHPYCSWANLPLHAEILFYLWLKQKLLYFWFMNHENDILEWVAKEYNKISRK